MKHVQITTDGSCYPNPGPGGWSAVIRFKDSFREISGSNPNTTNNQMELKAVIESLKALLEPCRVLIRTDSQTTICWCQPGSFSKPSQQENRPVTWAMVQEYRRISAQHEIAFEWIPGHTGDEDNERCDVLAAEARRGRDPAHFPDTNLVPAHGRG